MVSMTDQKIKIVYTMRTKLWQNPVLPCAHTTYDTHTHAHARTVQMTRTGTHRDNDAHTRAPC